MAIVKFKHDPNKLPALSPEVKSAHNAMTNEQITIAALSDLDNPPLTDEDRLTTAHIAKRARAKLSLTQVEFAKRYRIN
jgi:hypothetical protein